MELSIKLKERFCKDCNIPINIFQEPYFTDRLKLYDKYYGTFDKWNTFVEELNNYNNEQDYFEDYNRIKDEAINYIKSTEAYQNFNEEDMNQYPIIHKGLPSKDIYHPSNDGKTFISIDMKKANFSTLYFYNASMFDADTWEEFIGKFTDNKHIINSKYIRQVILGNCNPKRHITFEKYLMDMLLNRLLNRDFCFTIDRVVFFSNDEIIIDVSDIDEMDRYMLLLRIEQSLRYTSLPLKIEMFKLNKIIGTNGYYKVDMGGEVEFKCLDSFYLPFVIRHFQNEEVTESDKMFYNNGLLAKFVEVPEIKVGEN